MHTLKRILVVAFAPAAQQWALVEGGRNAPYIRPAISRGKPKGKRARPRAIWRAVAAH